jgi:hypothetical protein
MKYLGFKTYMETLANYGVDRRIKDRNEEQRPEKENPINFFDLEYMRDMLCERMLGEMHPFSRFVNEVQWGDGPGALRFNIDPKTGVYIERLGVDLSGEKRWCTKKYFQINRHGYGGFEEVVTQELFDHLQEIYKDPMDSPSADYRDLKMLVINMAERLRKEARPLFLFDRIAKMDENRYLICFNVRGQGVQAPGQTRIEKNVTDVNYYPNEGYIRVINYNYESPLGEHKWEVSGPDMNLFYFPTQSRDEIIDPVATNLRFY